MVQYESFRDVVLKIMDVYESVVLLSREDHRHCVYGRGANGVGCFVGCLLPDEVVGEVAEFEGRSVGRLAEVFPRFREIFPFTFDSGNVNMGAVNGWTHIQQAHDEAKTVGEALGSLVRMALGLGWITQGDIPAQVEQRIRKYRKDERERHRESINEVRGLELG